MTTTEIIELLQSDPVLANRVMSGMPDREKGIVSTYYGISCKKSNDNIIAQSLNLSVTRVHQLVGSGLIWLRHPSRIRIITEYKNQQRRQQQPMYRMWNRIVEHTQKIINPVLQKQAKNIERN